MEKNKYILAERLAYWHGQHKVSRDTTVASIRGKSVTEYTKQNASEYVEVAEFVLSLIRST